MKRMLRNAIRESVSRGIGDAIEKAVQDAVEPKATELAGKAAEYLDRKTGGSLHNLKQSSSELESALSTLEKTMQGYTEKMSQSTKVCTECGQPASAHKEFCPACGAALPKETLAQGAQCPNCGKQNDLRSKFCEDCGAKLPSTLREEELQARRDAEELARWDALLPHFPKWSCGGNQYNLEEYGGGTIVFSAGFDGDAAAAQAAVLEYRKLLKAHGFRPAGRYPSEEQLYKMDGDVCCHADIENCFNGDPDRPSVGFEYAEPPGGFHYVKPEPKKPAGLKDLFRR